jgi:hypothetical protein
LRKPEQHILRLHTAASIVKGRIDVTKRNLRRDNSGQVIVITALMVALVLLSTAIFVIETEKDVPTDVVAANSVLPAYQQAARNTLISALANISNGGNPDVLTTDFKELESAITSNSYQSILQMSFTPIYLSYGANSQGISSACIMLELNSTGATSKFNFECLVNVTSEVNLSGRYQLSDNSTQISLTVNLSNEGTPALARYQTFYVENATAAWSRVNSPTITDFGNGTYTVSFTAQTSQLSDPPAVSVLCQDQRGILVEANATCTNMG